MQVEVATIVQRMMTAGERWEAALDAHALAPPDAGFPIRLRALANAAAEQAEAFDLAASGGLGWRARAVGRDFALAPELTPGMNRPGPPERWERFDRATAGFAAALSGSSPAALAAAFRELSEIAGVLAAEQQPKSRVGRATG